jgi:transposase
MVTAEPILQHLADHDRLPDVHFMDAGYVDAQLIVASREQHQVTVCGPVMLDTSWQARAGQGFAASDFHINWAEHQATCPQGATSTGWKTTVDREGNALVKIAFPTTTCAACPVRHACTRAASAGRELTVRTEALHTTLQAARRDQTTPAFWKLYNVRAGIEGTLSQAVRRCDLRQARYIGLAKTHLQHLMISAALNLIRVIAWFAETPFARTRRSRFAALGPSPL